MLAISDFERNLAMMTRMAMELDGVSDSSCGYNRSTDYEHRDAEHEHDEEPEQADALNVLVHRL